MTDNNDLFSDYCRFRKIDGHMYDNFVLPAYLGEVLPDRKSAILDIGCGLGQFMDALGREGFLNVTGVDVSEEAVRHCLNKGLKAERIQGIESFCMSAGRKYDFIIMSHVLEHIEKPLIIPSLKLIRERLLNAEGEVLIMVPNAQSNTGCYWAYEDFTHHTLFTAGSLYFVLKSAGFESIDFLDPDGLEGSRFPFRWLRKILLSAYRTNKMFWNSVTSSSFHKPSPQIYTYELKALAR